MSESEKKGQREILFSLFDCVLQRHGRAGSGKNSNVLLVSDSSF